jgi:hypothetical protein
LSLSSEETTLRLEVAGSTKILLLFILPGSSGTTIRHNTQITHNAQTKHSTRNYTNNKGHTTHNEYNANTITTTNIYLNLKSGIPSKKTVIINYPNFEMSGCPDNAKIRANYVRCYHYSSEMRNEIYRVDHARE